MVSEAFCPLWGNAEHRANGVGWPQYELAAAFARKSSLDSSRSDTVEAWERRLSEAKLVHQNGTTL